MGDFDAQVPAGDHGGGCCFNVLRQGFCSKRPTHFSVRKFVQVQSQTGRSLAADDNAAKAADQTTKPASVELGPVGQQLKELTETRLQQYVPREQDRAGVLAFYRNRNFAPLWAAEGKAQPKAEQAIRHPR